MIRVSVMTVGRRFMDPWFREPDIAERPHTPVKSGTTPSMLYGWIWPSPYRPGPIPLRGAARSGTSSSPAES